MSSVHILTLFISMPLVYVLCIYTYIVHINAVSVCPLMLKALLQSSCQCLGNVMEIDKFLDTLHLLVVLITALVGAKHDGGNVAKYGGG